jgi:anaerobic selenocysteine-containing dehydrogenase
LCGLGLQHRPFVQYSDRVVEARGERREEWWIFGRLEQALGLKSVLDAGDAPPVFGRLDHMLGASGLSIEGLRESEDRTAVLPDLEPGRFYSDWIQTDHGRVDCCPALFDAALERSEGICQQLEAEPPGQLKLISRRDNYMHNSWYQNVPGLKRGKQARNVLYIHPDDAKAREILAGDAVRVSNEWGEIELPVEFDETLMPGVVAAVHGWGNAKTSGMRVAQAHPGTNCNQLLPSGPGSFEPLSNQAFMTGVPVEVCGAT